MIAIPNMEKQKDCKECQWHLDFYIEDEQVGGLCTITEKDDKENTCPLIEIVRCGECKWWNSGFCNNGRADANLKLEGNCFCDEGERRDDEHNT